MALFRRMHRRNLYQHSECSRPGKRRRMEAGAGRSGAQVGVCANVEVEVDVEEKRKKEKWVLSESGFESGESSAETNVDDTTDYDLESITPSSRKGTGKGFAKSMEDEERSGVGGLVDLAESTAKPVARAQRSPSPVLKRRDAEELRFSWHDAIKEAKSKLGVIVDS